jgi:hypothetical protein
VEYFCTICCKDKRTDPDPLPAIDRYLSERIAFVSGESFRLGKPMLILSGKYGLLRPEDPIPWYDQKLVMEGVPEIVPIITAQLREKEVTWVHFYCHPKTDLNWYPYHVALEQACFEQNVEISYQYVGLE